ncbi:MAG: fibronectin type III domain-containing protein [Acutalibacteraceae bacterium]
MENQKTTGKRIISLILALILVWSVFPTAFAESTKNPYLSTIYGSKKYVLYKQSVTYQQALSLCKQYGGKLAVITNAKENAAVKSLVSGFGASCWIDGTDEVSEGTWKHSDGSALTYSNWSAGEPNDFGGCQDYACIAPNGYWDDATNGNPLYGFVCEYKFSSGSGWKYANTLPSGVTSDKYTIEYRHIYETQATQSPGTGWKQGALVKTEYVDNGGTYESDFELATGPSRACVGTYYYHFCAAGRTDANYTLTSAYYHYDAISSDNVYVVYSHADYENSNYIFYNLKFNGTDDYVYCSSGFSCDGSYGTHGARTKDWYRRYIYQDRTPIEYYKYAKQSDWTSSRDKSAASYSVRYKLKYDTTPSKVTGLKASSVTSSSVKLSWNKVSLISGYRYYTYNPSSKKYTYLGKTTSTSVLVSGLKPSTTYYFSVRAYTTVGSKTYYGPYSSAVKVKTAALSKTPAKVSGLKASSVTETDFKLSWNRISNITGYYYFFYNPSSKKYTYISKTAGTTATIKNLKENKTYYVAVQAYSVIGKKTYYGKVSSALKVVTTKRPTVPSVGTISLSTEGKLTNIKISWKTDKLLTGYKVYRSTTGAKDSYKLIKTIESSSTGYYRDKSVSSAKRYYYMVRPYRIVRSKTYYGSYSAAKSIETYSAKFEGLNVRHLYFSFINNAEGFGHSKNYVIPLKYYTYILGNNEYAENCYNKEKTHEAGFCYGMSAGSAMLNVVSSGVSVKSFKSSATYPSELSVSDKGSLGMTVAAFLEIMQVSQFQPTFLETRNQRISKKNTLSDIVRLASSVPYTGKPIIVCIWSNDIGHAVVAYGATWVDSRTVRVKIFDPNHNGQERYLEVRTDSNGKATTWYYKSDVNYGSDQRNAYISYSTYDESYTVWKNRGKTSTVASSTNMLTVNSSNFEVYNSENRCVASMKDGKFESERDISLYMPIGQATEDTVLYLPSEETYTVINRDESEEKFELSMVNIERSAAVQTEGDTVTFTVSDDDGKNEVILEPDKNEAYSVEIRSSDKKENESVEVVGTGEGNAILTAQNDGKIELENVENADVYLNESDTPLTERELETITE